MSDVTFNRLNPEMTIFLLYNLQTIRFCITFSAVHLWFGIKYSNLNVYLLPPCIEPRSQPSL